MNQLNRYLKLYDMPELLSPETLTGSDEDTKELLSELAREMFAVKAELRKVNAELTTIKGRISGHVRVG